MIVAFNAEATLLAPLIASRPEGSFAARGLVLAGAADAWQPLIEVVAGGA